MTAIQPNTIQADLQRHPIHIHEDVRNHPLASIRGSALAARLRRLVEGAMQQVNQGRMQTGMLVPIRA